MNISAKEKNNNLIINNLQDFDIDQIFNSGQSFRNFSTEDGSYINIVSGRAFRFSQNGSSLMISNSDLSDLSFWDHYFDLSTDYSFFKNHFKNDLVLSKATSFGSGIRILNQEPFETLITFILSANNNIPRIKNNVERISKNYGNKIKSDLGTFYSFPDAKKLASLCPEDLRENCGVGFRDKRIVETSELIADGNILLDDIFDMDTNSARKYIMQLPGVGPKVADCVLLFSFKKRDVFPVDTWIQKIMYKHYVSNDFPKTKLNEFGINHFGEYSGLAQQYLFYYARENKI
ncbi:MAG: DNA-3-methyladenine glycosylase 2 family protein [Methanosarcinaceae archaeon]|nr:DNA-3-methyladenine glycosylase 2 family protein [Methanosarcinaceae archaeon]